MSKTLQRQPPHIQPGLSAADAFQNELARTGFGQPNLISATSYPLNRIDFNYQLMDSLYRGSWICASIVDTPAEDMLKKWIKLQSEIKPGYMDLIKKTVRKTGLRAKLLEGTKWGRLYGGAVGVILLKGQGDPETLAQPMDVQAVLPGDFLGLMILDRWTGAFPSQELVSDITSPDFNLPQYYDAQTADGRNAFRVHHSRVVRFTGVDLPLKERIAEQYWGMSILERVIEEVVKRDNTSANIAGLVFRANIGVRKLKDFDQLMASGNTQAKQRIFQSIEAQNILLNNFAQMLVGTEEEMEFHNYTFAGLSDIYEQFMLDIAGAAKIPATKLFGRSPAGLNSTGESDLTNYYDMISQEQETHLRPVLDKLLPIIAMSAWGAIPDDLDFEFNSPRTIAPKELADLAKSHTEAIASAYDANLITQRAAAKELKRQSELTGLFTSITEEEIEAAEAGYGLPGGDLGIGGMLGMDAEWREDEHPRKDDGKFGSGSIGGKNDKNKALTEGKESDNLSLLDIDIGRNEAVTYESGDGTIYTAVLEPGSKITKVRVFAGAKTKKPIHVAPYLEGMTGIPQGKWDKVQGEGTVRLPEGRKSAILHWFQAAGKRYSTKVKRWK